LNESELRRGGGGDDDDAVKSTRYLSRKRRDLLKEMPSELLHHNMYKK
jgi:hypothetical protein